MANDLQKLETAPEGWDSEQIPLLLQGFDIQSVNYGGAPVFRDLRKFQLEQFRGVVTKLEYLAGYLALYVNGVDEGVWIDAKISLKGGGRDLLVQEMAERYDYLLDLGRDQDTAIKTRLAGGQQLESLLEISSTGTLSTQLNISAQLLAQYSTKKLEDWKKTLDWKAGTFVKRQSFKFDIDPAVLTTETFSGTLPKNQGPIIGVSITILSAELFNYKIGLKMNGLEIVKDVWGLRFTRNSPREPFILFYPFSAGSKFDLTVDKEALVGNDGNIFITFYFDN